MTTSRLSPSVTSIVPAKVTTMATVFSDVKRQGVGSRTTMARELPAASSGERSLRTDSGTQRDSATGRRALPPSPTGRFKGCNAYADFRELLDRPDIDAVAIVVPDRWHALIAVAALQAGKDVYCEKPLSLTIYEGQEIVNAVRQNQRIFQTALSSVRARRCGGPVNWSATDA